MKNKPCQTAFLPNGELDCHGIDETAHTVMATLVDGIKAAVPAPASVLVWLHSAVTALYNMGGSMEFVDTLKLLYALARIVPFTDIELFIGHPVAANYFVSVRCYYGYTDSYLMCYYILSWKTVKLAGNL